MRISRITRAYGHIQVTATEHDGTTAAIAAVDVALLPPRSTPDCDTTWAPADLTDSTARILLAGPDADPTSAHVVPLGGADLWARVVDSPEVTTALIGRITVT